tara:strand:+ start:132 stop:281 length:150 start_codon:yes stop_codon:yes gene_type:complete
MDQEIKILNSRYNLVPLSRKNWGKTGRDKRYSTLILLSLSIIFIPTIEI